MYRRRGWLAALLALPLAISACNRGGSDGPKAPVIESFTVNDVSFDPDTGQGLIVTKPVGLKLEAQVSSTYPIQSVTISYTKRPSTSYTAFEPCTTLNCSRTWSVTQSDNGTYDFRVQAVDTMGNKVELNYPASVSISIQ